MMGLFNFPLRLEPDGSTLVADKPIQTPYGGLSQHSLLPYRTPSEIGLGSGNLTVVAGSSTVARCWISTAEPDWMVADRSGWWGAMQAQFGNPFFIRRGGVVAASGVTTDTVLTQVTTALALGTGTKYVIANVGGNDDFNSAATVGKVENWTRKMIEKTSAYGAKFFLILQHLSSTNAGPSTAHTNFMACRERLLKLKAQYSGIVFLVDHLAAVSDSSQMATLPEYINGLHLNVAGNRRVAEYAWGPALREAGLITGVIDPTSFGTLINPNAMFRDADGAFSLTGWSTFAPSGPMPTLVDAGYRDPYGRNVARLTQATTNIDAFASYVMASGVGGAASDIYRIVASFKPVQNCYSAGMYIRESGTPVRQLRPLLDAVVPEYAKWNDGQWYSFVSDPFKGWTELVSVARVGFIINNLGQSSDLAICDIAGVGLVRAGTAWA